MRTKIIPKNKIHDWMQRLAENNQLIAPTQVDDDTWEFTKIEDPISITLDHPSPTKGSLREHFVPETEVLFNYKKSAKTIDLTPNVSNDAPRVIVGARACDGAALKYIDTVYSNADPIDSLYFARRNQTSIIGLFCTAPQWNCFCTEVNDSLTNPINIDLMLTDIGDRYIAEIYSEKGEALGEIGQFAEASQEDIDAAKSIKDAVITKLPSHEDHGNRSLSYDWDHGVWRKLAQKCLGCGICTFLCPTCHCFDIQEFPMGKRGFRFRCWDTCQFDKFTLMASGYNPRPSKKERTRQRVFHKFKYSQERYGILGCVGCGRCISACPVNISIEHTVHELEETSY